MTVVDRRRQLPTPKGEAAKSLQHAKSTLGELERILDSNRVEDFVYRLNDFLRAARTVIEFLSKEPRGPTGRVYTRQHRGIPAMRQWVQDYTNDLSSQDRERLEVLTQLREVSTHDLAVRPDRGAISVEVSDDRISPVDSVGKLLYQHDFGSPDAENVIQSSTISVKYFLSNHGSEDVLTICRSIVEILEHMVGQAYSKFP